MEVLFLTILASAAALAGGITALKNTKRINQALALTSGLILGLVLFDLLPEIFEISEAIALDPIWPMIAMASGFLVFHIFEKLIPLHASGEDQYGPHRHPSLGVARAAALTGHSYLDGLSIGLAFQVNSTVGASVALAVIGHRFADGFDTTMFMIFNKNKLTHIKKWLYVVILMPIIGGLSSFAFSLSETSLAIYLGFFAGFLLYIATGNILPQAHSKDSSRAIIALTVLGLLIMLAITRIA